MQNTISTNINFSNDGIDIGKSDSPFSVNINNQCMSFKEEGTEVAYISNKEMRITDAIVENSMILGNFKFIPRTTGNMSLIWDDMGNMIDYYYAYPNKMTSDYLVHTAILNTKPIPGELYTIEICSSFTGSNYWGCFDEGANTNLLYIESWRFHNGVAKKSFFWGSENINQLLLYAMPQSGTPTTLTYVKLFKGDSVWRDNGNLLRFNNEFDIPKGTTGGLYISATSDDYYSYTSMYCYLEPGVDYMFTCEVDGGEGDWSADGEDTVQAYLVNKDVENWTHQEILPNETFSVTTSARYWLRLDVNKNGCSHWFSNMWITKV